MQLVKIANKNYNNYKQTDEYKSTVLRDSMNDLFRSLMNITSPAVFETLNEVVLASQTLSFLESRNLLRGGNVDDGNVGYRLPGDV